jgi:hypothetical protein
VIRLGPWHIDVEITPEVSTAASLDAPPGSYSESAGKISFSNRYQGIMERLQRMFPRGLEGRSVLDCACNCGAYLFWSKEHGAGECFGFDAREHWIEQARFLAANRVKSSEGMRFEVCDLRDLPAVAQRHFDVTWFSGIFYHLPDPIAGLKVAADLTDELLILNTATKAEQPDGAIVVSRENPDRLLAGMDALNWFPTGPAVLTRILNWLGFPEVRCTVWRSPPNQKADLDRIEMIAAREPGYLSEYDAAREQEDPVARLIATAVAPRSTVAVIGRADAPKVPGRETVPVELPVDVAAVERLRDAGAGYLALTAEALEWLESNKEVATWIRAHETVASVPGGCEVHSLAHPDQG